mmetsp:Transcript_87024/g.144762  ORF Transcript_87024/g.144762 Transcript_87024/m.144762 type:complete len:243 (-) Transcript_87024:9-737(-)
MQLNTVRLPLETSHPSLLALGPQTAACPAFSHIQSSSEHVQPLLPLLQAIKAHRVHGPLRGIGGLALPINQQPCLSSLLLIEEDTIIDLQHVLSGDVPQGLPFVPRPRELERVRRDLREHRLELLRQLQRHGPFGLPETHFGVPQLIVGLLVQYINGAAQKCLGTLVQILWALLTALDQDLVQRHVVPLRMNSGPIRPHNVPQLLLRPQLSVGVLIKNELNELQCHGIGRRLHWKFINTQKH